MKKGRLQETVVDLVTRLTGASTSNKVPSWLKRPGKIECGSQWTLVKSTYAALTGLVLPDVMPSREWRLLDAVLVHESATPQILEVDETQHFNEFRALTLSLYTSDVQLAFDVQRFLDVSKRKSRLEGVGFGKPRPPLFPGDGGRHRQRAFRDALVDILPTQYGYAPTLRIAHFEVEDWILGNNAENRMRVLLEDRLKTGS